MNYTTIINLITQLLYDWENFARYRGVHGHSTISKIFDKF